MADRWWRMMGVCVLCPEGLEDSHRHCAVCEMNVLVEKMFVGERQLRVLSEPVVEQ